jgi:NADH dehydrogenase FAD-containing subunit
VQPANEIGNEITARPPPSSVEPQVLIVGAGFGGLKAAWSLRRARVQVTIIDRRNLHSRSGLKLPRVFKRIRSEASSFLNL